MKKVYFTTLLFGFYLGLGTVKAQKAFDTVANIIYTKCAYCHSPGNIGPEPLTCYSQIRPYAAAIKTEVSGLFMPPWAPDTTYRTTSNPTPTTFLHSRALTVGQKNAILKWVNDTASTLQRDSTSTTPICSTFYPHYQLAGKADLVVGTGLVESNSGVNGAPTNAYDCFMVPTGLKQDRWLRAVEIVPGNRKVVHHCVVAVDTTGTTAASQTNGNCSNQPGQFGIGGWSAGAAPVVYPNKAPFKAGQRIPKGSSISIQMHYAPGSGGLIDSTKIRLYFYPVDSVADIRPLYDMVSLQYWGLGGSGPSNIAANTAEWIYGNQGAFSPTTNVDGGSYIVPAPPLPISIIAVDPHSHYVCTQIYDYAYNGSGDTIPLIHVPNWDYRWQGYYYPPYPVKIPSGYTLQAKHYYNNTINNPNLLTNPDSAVTFGQATTNEMLFDAFIYAAYQTGDENISMSAILAGDSIYATGLEPNPVEPVVTAVSSLTGVEILPGKVINQYTVNPNPADNKLNISSATLSTYVGYIYNLTGQAILQTESFNSTISIDLSSIPNGMYILNISDIATGEKTAKKVIVAH